MIRSTVLTRMVQLFTSFGLSGPQFLHLHNPVLTVPALEIADLLKRIQAGPRHHNEAAHRVVLFVDFLAAPDGLLLLQRQLLLLLCLLLSSPFKQGLDPNLSSGAIRILAALAYCSSFRSRFPSARSCPDPKAIHS